MIAGLIDNTMSAVMFLTLGLVLLMFSGDRLVEGAKLLAFKLGIPTIIIGLTIVAFGTSAPELFIGVSAVLSGKSGIALGNVVGSNIANVLLVLGVPSIIAVTAVNQPAIRRNTTTMMIVSLIFAWMMLEDQRLDASEGISLLLMLALYLAYNAYVARKGPLGDPALQEMMELHESERRIKGGKIAAMILIGLIGLPLGAQMLVDGGVFLAEELGVDETIIGLTLVAVGTSLPELATTVMAALRRQSGVAIGNVIGSNLFNILAVMGVSLLVAGDIGIPISENVLRLDLWVMLGSSFLLVPLAFMRGKITRLMGLVFLAAYAYYIYYLFAQGMIH